MGAPLSSYWFCSTWTAAQQKARWYNYTTVPAPLLRCHLDDYHSRWNCSSNRLRGLDALACIPSVTRIIRLINYTRNGSVNYTLYTQRLMPFHQSISPVHPCNAGQLLGELGVQDGQQPVVHLLHVRLRFIRPDGRHHILIRQHLTCRQKGKITASILLTSLVWVTKTLITSFF